MRVTVWSLTVDRPDCRDIATTVQASEAECLESLRINYLDDEDAPVSDEALVEYATNTAGFRVYIDAHVVNIP
jgi:hypothetical protein